jgi:hypothetical protein
MFCYRKAYIPIKICIASLISMKFGVRVLYKNLWSKREFRGSRWCGSHTLLRGVSVLHFPHSLCDLGNMDPSLSQMIPVRIFIDYFCHFPFNIILPFFLRIKNVLFPVMDKHLRFFHPSLILLNFSMIYLSQEW